MVREASVNATPTRNNKRDRGISGLLLVTFIGVEPHHIGYGVLIGYHEQSPLRRVRETAEAA